MTQPTHDEVIAWIDNRIQEREGRIEGNNLCVRELSLAIQHKQDENATATIIHLENLIRIDKEIRASLLANRAVLERHKEANGFCWSCHGIYDTGELFPCPTYTDIYDPIRSVM